MVEDIHDIPCPLRAISMIPTQKTGQKLRTILRDKPLDPYDDEEATADDVALQAALIEYSNRPRYGSGSDSSGGSGNPIGGVGTLLKEAETHRKGQRCVLRTRG